jgi:hypothetical protein
MTLAGTGWDGVAAMFLAVLVVATTAACGGGKSQDPMAKAMSGLSQSTCHLAHTDTMLELARLRVRDVKGPSPPKAKTEKVLRRARDWLSSEMHPSAATGTAGCTFTAKDTVELRQQITLINCDMHEPPGYYCPSP